MNAMSADRRASLAYPVNRVVGTVADGSQAGEATAALLRAGFTPDDVDVLHGDADATRLDPESGEVGLLAQVRRTVVRAFEFEEFRHLSHHLDDLRAGRYVVMVKTKRRAQRIVAADVLHQYGAEFVGFYGRWAWADLPAAPRNTPQEIPALFARAWNDGNSEALASLFDEDAEYVSEAGSCCHDREAIRRAHASGIEQRAASATLVTGDTTVKLLSPEVAVVHTRMVRSVGPAPGAAAGTAAPRATIVSFVVHRVGDRWLCASAHHTDVAAPPPTNVGEPGVFGLPGYPDANLS